MIRQITVSIWHRSCTFCIVDFMKGLPRQEKLGCNSIRNLEKPRRKPEAGKKLIQIPHTNVSIPNFKDRRQGVPVALNTKPYSSLRHFIVKSMFFTFTLNFPFLISSYYSHLILYERTSGGGNKRLA